MQDSFMNWLPRITNHDFAIDLYSNTLIQVAGSGGDRVDLVSFMILFYFYLPAQAL